jgi:hypothetical protein
MLGLTRLLTAVAPDLQRQCGQGQFAGVAPGQTTAAARQQQAADQGDDGVQTRHASLLCFRLNAGAAGVFPPATTWADDGRQKV